MKLLTYRFENRTAPAILVGDKIADASVVAGRPFSTMIDLLELGESVLLELGEKAVRHVAESTEGVHSLDEVELQSPIPRPGKIMAVGLNYRDHALEQGKEPPKFPMIFAKFPTAVLRPGGKIVLPPNSDQVDNEAELCVVVGGTGTRIPLDEAMDYVAGYTIINDVTARDMQKMDKQYVRAKSCDTFAPLGPWIVLKDEIPDPHALDISLTLNGVQMQASNTRQLIFDVPFLIHYLSKSMTLETGDLIATGTPSGVGVFRTPPVFLKPGDVVNVTIEKIGTLMNRVS